MFNILSQKRCSKCREWKNKSEFYKSKKSKDGVNGHCKACDKQRKNNILARIRQKRYRDTHKEILAAKQLAWFEANPNKRKEYDRKSRNKKYGLSDTEYSNLLAVQGGVCAICKSDNKGNTLHIDHDHDTGVVRGLLCRNCNIALGHIFDNESLALKIYNYLTEAFGK